MFYEKFPPQCRSKFENMKETFVFNVAGLQRASRVIKICVFYT